MYAKMYEKLVVQVLGLAKDWYFMKRNLNYNGKTYTTLRKMCEGEDISYAGFAMYTQRKFENRLNNLSDDDVLRSFIEYVSLKSKGYGKSNRYVNKQKIIVDGVQYNTVKDMCKGMHIGRETFRRYCIAKTGTTLSKLSYSELAKLLDSYIVKKNIKVNKKNIKLQYNGVTYNTIHSACVREKVNYKEFNNYFLERFGFSLKCIGKESSEIFSKELSETFADFILYVNDRREKRLRGIYGDRAAEVKKRLGLQGMGVSYNGEKYESLSEACYRVCGSNYTQFMESCYNAIGVVPSKLYEEDVRNAMFSEYVDHRIVPVKVNQEPSGSKFDFSKINNSSGSVVYNGKCYNTVVEACRSVGVGHGAFLHFCKTHTGKYTSDLSPEERSKLFEIYARAKGKN